MIMVPRGYQDLSLRWCLDLEIGSSVIRRPIVWWVQVGLQTWKAKYRLERLSLLKHEEEQGWRDIFTYPLSTETIPAILKTDCDSGLFFYSGEGSISKVEDLKHGWYRNWWFFSTGCFPSLIPLSTKCSLFPLSFPSFQNFKKTSLVAWKHYPITTTLSISQVQVYIYYIS